jgi:hypothetical protein
VRLLTYAEMVVRLPGAVPAGRQGTQRRVATSDRDVL